MYRIVTGNHKTLTQISTEVEHGEDCSNLIDKMKELMIDNSGIGLAANQVDVAKRVIVMVSGNTVIELINPEITRQYFGKSKGLEGCLSFPNKLAKMYRWNRVNVKGFDRDWNLIELKLKGLAARCVQHEIDHLNGINIA